MGHGAYTPAANRGFTLIEIVITIVILGAVAGILVPFFNAIVHSPDPVIRERAISLGQSLMDEIMTKKWDEITPLGGGPICTAESSSKGIRSSLVDNCANPGALTASAISADPGETKRTDYDDMDDYNGISESTNFTDQNGNSFTMNGYSRKVEVYYVASKSNPISSDKIITPPVTGNATDTKLVVVTVTSPLNETFNFVAVACNI